MKKSTKDTTMGVYHQLAGRARVLAGKVIKSPGLQAEGKIEMVAGKAQKKKGEVKHALEKKTIKNQATAVRKKTSTKMNLQEGK